MTANSVSSNCSSLLRVWPSTASSMASACRSNCRAKLAMSSSVGSFSPNQTKPSPSLAFSAARSRSWQSTRRPSTYQAHATTESGVVRQRRWAFLRLAAGETRAGLSAPGMKRPGARLRSAISPPADRP